MLELYWGCLVFGLILAFVSIIFGDLLGDVLGGVFHVDSDIMQPMVVVGGLTIFGGAGVLLTKYTSLETWPVVIFALLIAFGLSTIIYFAYVKPMKNSENSIAFSVADLIGQFGEVIVPIPAQGCGEILIQVGTGNTNQIAASLKGQEIVSGSQVVVASVKEGVLYVYPYEGM